MFKITSSALEPKEVKDNVYKETELLPVSTIFLINITLSY